VITNSLRLASVLEEKAAQRPNLEVYVYRWISRSQSGILLGPTPSQASPSICRLGFLSVGGISHEGVSNTNEQVTQAERVMIRNADRVVVLADHSKIGKNAMCHVCPLDQVDTLITDHWPENQGTIQQLTETGVEVITCSLQFE
jgi:DeoR/GlpR family transcriptional regulator of sugar metabolism